MSVKREKEELCQMTLELLATINSLPESGTMISAGWVDSEPGVPIHRKSNMAYYCSACGHTAGKFKHNTYRFCPWCGARMTEADE